MTGPGEKTRADSIGGDFARSAARSTLDLHRVASVGEFGTPQRVAHPFVICQLPDSPDWMIPLQYVIAGELVLPFRVADPFDFRGSGF
jgi:hypothetical protein